MVVCQGEGPELDIQRRRHPMWEWLLSHPVTAGAVFFAEMLAPLAANPVYWAAPLFPGLLYGIAHGPVIGVVAAILIGIPLTVAAACVGKMLEIAAMLRLPLRRRGAAIGIIGWFGFASMILMFVVNRVMPGIAHMVSGWIDETGPSWSVLRLFLGMDGAGGFALWRGVAVSGAFSMVAIAASVAFSARSVRQGLSGAFASDGVGVRRGKAGRFGREPLFRKEYLWFVRDRSALVQTILIPVTIAGIQLVNFHSVMVHAADMWNYLCAAAIFFGTYFLWILGPKSLTSEGSALWIAMTWPRGLEAMLKAKAWLWSMIASVLVGIALLVACWMFPHDAWKIALVGVAWCLFARSMAEKAVTLVTIVSESGEAQKLPRGRLWAAQLGMFTFAVGVVTQQWHLVIVGIVYSWITAAAMWENLRARLPYLYDPWSERLPPPPTLMHAMIAISILVECNAIISAFTYTLGGKAIMATVQALSYALCAIAVSIGMALFLARRGWWPRSCGAGGTRAMPIGPGSRATLRATGVTRRGCWAESGADWRWRFSRMVMARSCRRSLDGRAHACGARADGCDPRHGGQLRRDRQIHGPFAEEFLFRGCSIARSTGNGAVAGRRWRGPRRSLPSTTRSCPGCPSPWSVPRTASCSSGRGGWPRRSCST
ncbi:hypothetical protein P0F65_00055 [Sphingomonas sp. I4]